MANQETDWNIITSNKQKTKSSKKSVLIPATAGRLSTNITPSKAIVTESKSKLHSSLQHRKVTVFS